MEFFENIFASKRKKQEGLMQELEISGQYHKDDFVGPNYLRGDTVSTQPDKFLEVVDKLKIEEVSAKAGRGSDTHTPFDVFAEVDEKTHLYMKATASRPEWYSPPNPDEYQTLLPKLEEMGFKKDPELSKDEWSVYIKE